MPRLIESLEHVVPLSCGVAEGPVWDPAAEVLWWVDITGSSLHRWRRATASNETLALQTLPGAVAPAAAGGLVAAVAEGFVALDPDTGATSMIVELAGPVPMRMNDGKVDPAGRFWAGLMGGAAEPEVGVLYRLEGGRAEPVLDGLTIPNGIGWSPDASTMYYVDSPTRRLDAFDFDLSTGSIDNRRAIARFDEPVLPDGLTVDSDGGVWVALWDGAAVHRYTPDGELDVVVSVPGPQASSCTFGGPDLDELYITEATTGLYRCRPGFTGLPPTPFAG